MKKKVESHKNNSNSFLELDEKKSAIEIYKKVIQTDIYNEKERNAILEIVNNYIDDFNNSQQPSDDEDGFKTVGQQKKRNKFEDYNSLKWKVYNDIQSSFTTTSYIKKQLPIFKMELSNKELNIIFNFLSTVINMVEPIIYDDIKPVGEKIGENRYIIHIQYFPRITLHQSYEYTLRERLFEEDKYKHQFRAEQIRQGLLKNHFQNLDKIDGFFEDFHIEFKNIQFLGVSDEIKYKNSQDITQSGQKSEENEENLLINQFENNLEINKQVKSLNKSPQFNPQNNINGCNNAKQKLTFEECRKKLIQTIAAMMNTQGGSIFIPIKENQNLQQEQLYSLEQILMTEEQLKNKIRSFFDEITFYHINGELIEEQEKTQEIINQLIPNVSSIKDEEGNIKVFEIIVFQVYPQYICNLAHNNNKSQNENNQKLINQKELNFEFPIRRSAANCTVIFSKDQMKQSLEKATLFTKIQKNLSEEEQLKLFNYKKYCIQS